MSQQHEENELLVQLALGRQHHTKRNVWLIEYQEQSKRVRVVVWGNSWTQRCDYQEGESLVAQGLAVLEPYAGKKQKFSGLFKEALVVGQYKLTDQGRAACDQMLARLGLRQGFSERDIYQAIRDRLLPDSPEQECWRQPYS